MQQQPSVSVTLLATRGNRDLPASTLMAKTTHVVEVIGGTPRMDLWCDQCQTSGRFVIGTRGATPVGTVRQCVRCDYDNTETP